MKSKILCVAGWIMLVLTIVLLFVPLPWLPNDKRAVLSLILPWIGVGLFLWSRIESLNDLYIENLNYSVETRQRVERCKARLYCHFCDPKPHEDSDLVRVDELYGFVVGHIDDDFIMNRQSVKLLRRKRKIRSDIPAKVRQEAREALQKDEFKRSREWFCNLEDDLK